MTGAADDKAGKRAARWWATRFTLTPAARSLLLLSVGQGFYRVSGLLLVSMYASELGPAAYGRLEQWLALSLLVTPLVSLQVYESFLSLFQRDRKSGVSVAAAIFGCMALACIAVAVGAAALWPVHADLVVAFAAHVVTTTAWQIMRNLLRAMRRLDVTVRGEILQAALSLALGAVFLFGLGWGVIGVLVAVAVANIGATAYAGARCLGPHLLGVSAVSRDALSSVLAVSARLVPNVALWWGIELSDRMILAYFEGDRAVGIYAAGSRIAGILMSAMLLLYQLWQIPAIDALHRRDRDFFATTLGPFAVVTAMCASVLLVVAQPLSRLLMGPEFAESHRFIAVLVPASCLAALCYYLGIIYYSTQERFSAIGASVAGLLVSLVINVLLIPLIGPIAAALAALLAYLTMLVLRYRQGREHLGLSIRPRAYVLPTAIVSIQAIGLYCAMPPTALAVGTLVLAVVLRDDLRHLLGRLQARKV